MDSEEQKRKRIFSLNDKELVICLFNVVYTRIKRHKDDSVGNWAEAPDTHRTDPNTQDM